MTAKSMRRISILAALLLSASFAADVSAQCCGGGATAFYQPTAYTAYSPVAFQQYRTGWYPGYWWNRIGTRLWGSPNTYVAAYPTTAFRPVTTVGYSSAAFAMPTSGCSTCSSYSASYAPAPCSTCASPCSTCTTAYSPFSGCTTCGTSAVAQAVYQQPAYQPSAGCATCGTATAIQGTTMMQPGAVVVPAPAPTIAIPAPQGQVGPAPTPAPQSTYGGQNGAPSLPSDVSVPEQREEQKPPTNGAEQSLQPEPGSDTNGSDPYDVNGANGDNSTYFQAPQLFDPNDRTAQRSIAPVRTALYEQPASYYGVTAKHTTVTKQQAAADAAGWVSASK